MSMNGLQTQATLTVRNLRRGELLPPELATDSVFDAGRDPALSWVAERDGRLVGLVMIARAHQTTIVLKVKTVEQSPEIFGLLMRAVVREAASHQDRWLVTFLDTAAPIELRFLHVMGQVAGARFAPVASGVWASVPSVEVAKHA